MADFVQYARLKYEMKELEREWHRLRTSKNALKITLQQKLTQRPCAISVGGCVIAKKSLKSITNAIMKECMVEVLTRGYAEKKIVDFSRARVEYRELEHDFTEEEDEVEVEVESDTSTRKRRRVSYNSESEPEYPLQTICPPSPPVTPGEQPSHKHPSAAELRESDQEQVITTESEVEAAISSSEDEEASGSSTALLKRINSRSSVTPPSSVVSDRNPPLEIIHDHNSSEAQSADVIADPTHQEVDIHNMINSQQALDQFIDTLVEEVEMEEQNHDLLEELIDCMFSDETIHRVNLDLQPLQAMPRFSPSTDSLDDWVEQAIRSFQQIDKNSRQATIVNAISMVRLYKALSEQNVIQNLKQYCSEKDLNYNFTRIRVVRGRMLTRLLDVLEQDEDYFWDIGEFRFSSFYHLTRGEMDKFLNALCSRLEESDD